MSLSLSTEEERAAAATEALSNAEVLEALIEQLGSESRLKRQKASSTLKLVAEKDASLLFPFAEEICEGLNRPEAQTRWEVLNILDMMGKAGQRFDSDVIASAEDALYDEDNGIVREAAFRFFCGYGGASESNSTEVWPLIDEAIQCYHGNPEFADMLTHLVEFANGSISMEASAALAMRMRFDAENGSGTLKMRANQIVQAYLDRGGTLGDDTDSKNE